METGIQLIAAERERQKREYPYDNKHDDAHTDGEIASAAAAYIVCDLPAHQFPAGEQSKDLIIGSLWRWAEGFWKPAGRKRNLIRAGALIAADLDRLIRIEVKQQHRNDDDSDVIHPQAPAQEAG